MRLVVLLVLFGLSQPAAAGTSDPPFPRLANVYLHGAVDPTVIPQLARWDLLVLDSIWSDAQLGALRAQNPNIRSFFYLCAYCSPVPPARSDTWRMDNFIYAQTWDLWWRNYDRTVASDWPGTSMINITERGASGPAGNWRTYYKGRVEALVGSRRMLDGVFFDNFWRGIGWQQGRALNLDSDCSPRGNPAGCNGMVDPPAVVDSLWNRALRDVASDMRVRFDRMEPARGRPVALLSNGANDYFPWLNGTMYENFPELGGDAERGNPHGYRWQRAMLGEPGGYLVAPFRLAPYGASIINASWTGSYTEPQRNPEFERHKRFTLGSALLGDGYYSLDTGTAGHGHLWWEPEYDHDGRGKGYLGYPRGPAVRIGRAIGQDHVVNGSWTVTPMPWQAHVSRALASYERDNTGANGTAGSGRLVVDAVQRGGSVKLYQTVPMLGGFRYTLSFWAKSDRRQKLLVHIYGNRCIGHRCLDDHTFTLAPWWKKYDMSFIATGNEWAGLNFILEEPGTTWIDEVSLRGGNSTLYRRDFDNGIVLVNYTEQAQRVDLTQPYRRLSVAGSAVWDGAIVGSETVPPWDARILLRERTSAPTPSPEKGGAGARPGLLPADTNPFRPGAALRFRLAHNEPVHVEIYDVAGRRVRTLVNEARGAGIHELRWDGTNEGGARAAAGIYIVRMQTPTVSGSHKITLLP